MISIQFLNFWSKFNINNNYFTQLLDFFNIEYTIINDRSKESDIIIYSCFKGDSPFKSSTKKYIFFSGEPKDIDSKANFNLTFNENTKNNFRLPLWLIHVTTNNSQGHFIGNFDRYNFKSYEILRKDENNKKNKFCIFISSAKKQHRIDFVNKLSNYKKVDCGGNVLNNIQKVNNKIEFAKNYKFSIVFEGKDSPGYITEKIIDAYKGCTVPIFWGNKYVVNDFNKDTFINSNDFENWDKLIEYIIKVDNDDDLYNSFFNKPIFSNQSYEILNNESNSYFKNLSNIISKI